VKSATFYDLDTIRGCLIMHSHDSWQAMHSHSRMLKLMEDAVVIRPANTAG
jgi:hypothetical protein